MKTITELELEVQELREELRKTNAIISEILGLSIIPKVKYTDEEIYKVRHATSLSKAAAKLRISKSSVQRACRRYEASLINDLEE